MENHPSESGRQPYEPFMFARKHALSIHVAREILDAYGGDRPGADDAAKAYREREVRKMFVRD